MDPIPTQRRTTANEITGCLAPIGVGVDIGIAIDSDTDNDPEREPSPGGISQLVVSPQGGTMDGFRNPPRTTISIDRSTRSNGTLASLP
jgi:hypothetical protein